MVDGKDESIEDWLKDIYDPNALPTAETQVGAVNQFDLVKITVEKVIGEWGERAESERKERTFYAKLLLGLLSLQVVAVNLAFFLIGFQLMGVDQWTARVFILAVFTELAAMVFFIVKYLFSRDEKQLPELIKILQLGGRPEPKPEDDC